MKGNVGAAKHDYRKNPMVLLGWGLASDFDVYKGSRLGRFFRNQLALLVVVLGILFAMVW